MCAVFPMADDVPSVWVMLAMAASPGAMSQTVVTGGERKPRSDPMGTRGRGRREGSKAFQI